MKIERRRTPKRPEPETWTEKDLAQARRAHEMNKARVEAGETYRSQAPSAYSRKRRS